MSGAGARFSSAISGYTWQWGGGPKSPRAPVRFQQPAKQGILSLELTWKWNSPWNVHGSGTPTHTHSDIGLLLTIVNSILTLRRKVRERHGEKSKKIEGVSTMVWCTSAVRERRARQLTAAKERLWGMKTCNHHESNKADWNSLCKSCLAGT